MNVDGIVVDSLLDLILNAVEHGKNHNMSLTHFSVTQAQYDQLKKELEQMHMVPNIAKGDGKMKIYGLTIEVWK